MSEETIQDTSLATQSRHNSENTLSQELPVSTSQEKPTEPAPELPDKEAAPARPVESHLGAIPDGGIQAWLHVVGGFFLFFNTFGLLNAFGVFQTYYESGDLFTASSSNIAWVGAIQAYLMLTIGFVSGPIYDRGYLRTLLGVGGFGVVFGHMMLSLCKTYWQVLLAQGFCVGIGAGCLFVPCVSVIPQYFSRRLGLALGLASSGSSMGGVIYPIVLYRLIDRIGFPWSVRVVGFIALATMLFPIAVMKMRVKAAHARNLIDWSAFTDLSYMSFSIGAFLGFMGLGVVLFYLSYYAQDARITTTKMAFYILPIFNAASCFGRIVPNAISDKVGPLNMITPGALILGTLTLCLMAVQSLASLVVIAILSGFFSGVFIALPPVCFVVLTHDKRKIGTRMGMGFGMISFGLLASGPGAGAILGQVDPLEWNGLWAFGGVSCCLAGLIFAVLRVLRIGFKLSAKG